MLVALLIATGEVLRVADDAMLVMVEVTVWEVVTVVELAPAPAVDEAVA